MPPAHLITLVVLLAALDAGRATDPDDVHAAAASAAGVGVGSGTGVSIVSSKEDDGCARLLGNGLFATFEKRPSDSSSAAQTALQTAMVSLPAGGVCRRAGLHTPSEMLKSTPAGRRRRRHPNPPACGAACARPAAPQCSAATEVVELGTTRGGVRSYGIYVEDAAFRLAPSAKEADKRLNTYRCASLLRQPGWHAACTCQIVAAPLLPHWHRQCWRAGRSSSVSGPHCLPRLPSCCCGAGGRCAGWGAASAPPPSTPLLPGSTPTLCVCCQCLLACWLRLLPAGVRAAACPPASLGAAPAGAAASAAECLPTLPAHPQITSYAQCVDMSRRGLSMEPTISRDGLTMTITLGGCRTCCHCHCCRCCHQPGAHTAVWIPTHAAVLHHPSTSALPLPLRPPPLQAMPPPSPAASLTTATRCRAPCSAATCRPSCGRGPA